MVDYVRNSKMWYKQKFNKYQRSYKQNKNQNEKKGYFFINLSQNILFSKKMNKEKILCQEGCAHLKKLVQQW